MARPTHAEVEQNFRAVFKGAGLPEPDEVAHWTDVVAFYWHDDRSVIIVDLDEVDPTFEGRDPHLAFPEPFGGEFFAETG